MSGLPSILLRSGMRIVCDGAFPDWQVGSFHDLHPGVLFAGIHVYSQLVYALLVRPNQLETDPGPLDARVS